MRRLLILTIILLSATMALGQVEPAKIGIGDVLTLVVIGHDEFSGQLTVASDGSISAPALGRLSVAGLTLVEAEKAAHQKLENYVRDPDVSLSFDVQANAFIFVTGLTSVPARTPYSPELDARKLLSGAEIGANADKLICRVFRGGDEIESFALLDLMNGVSGQWIGPLMAGDVFVVMAKPTIRVWFLESFVRPGETILDEGTSLAQAFAHVGGVSLGTPLDQSGAAAPTRDKMSLVVRRGSKNITFNSLLNKSSQEFILEAGDTISLDVPRHINVVMAGEIVLGGDLIIEDHTDILVALAKSQGIKASGTLNGVLVFRQGKVHSLDLSRKLGDKGYTEFPLMADDLVVVPENTRYIYVLGEVTAPGRFAFPDGEDINAADALAMASGVSSSGTLRRVSLIRPNADGVYEAVSFNIDEFLKDGVEGSNPEMQPGDVLYFGQPKGITLDHVSRFLSSFLLIDALLRR